MSLYFFDLRSAGSFSRDDVGMELPDAEAAHDMAFDALVALARDGITEGTMGQRYTIEVRNGIGAVLEVTGVFDSKILRWQ